MNFDIFGSSGRQYMLNAIDKILLQFINLNLANPVLDFIFILLSDPRFLFGILAAIILVMIVHRVPHTGDMVLLCLIGLALTDPLCSQILKKLFMRLRPCHTDLQLRTIVDCGGLYGFPSNHAANSAVVAYIVGRFRHRLAFFMWILAVAIAISRVYLGKHYPSDVVAGLAVGIFMGVAILWVRRRIVYPRKRPAEHDERSK